MIDKDDARKAAEAATLVAHLQHSQDHRLTTAEQQRLADAKSVLQDLILRIKSGVEL